MQKYIHISVADGEQMSLTMARLITGKYIRPDIDPGTEDAAEGYFVINNGGYTWMTKKEFDEDDFYTKPVLTEEKLSDDR